MCSELRRISVTDEVLQPPKGSDPAQISFGSTAGCRGVWALPVLQLGAGAWDVCDYTGKCLTLGN